MENTTSPALAEGEIPIAIIQITGHAPYHLILLPGSANDVTHEAATEWAASIGGDLPTRSEQALLFANLKDQFEKAAYWAAPRHESAPDFAWYQHFDHGRQLGYHRHLPLRARAVRRLIIQ